MTEHEGLKIVAGVSLVLARLDHALVHQIVDNSRVVVKGGKHNSLGLDASLVINRVEDGGEAGERPLLGQLNGQNPLMLGILEQLLARAPFVGESLNLVVWMQVEALGGETSDQRPWLVWAVTDFQLRPVMLILEVVQNREGDVVDSPAISRRGGVIHIRCSRRRRTLRLLSGVSVSGRRNAALVRKNVCCCSGCCEDGFFGPSISYLDGLGFAVSGST